MAKLIAPLGLLAWLAIAFIVGHPEPRALPARAAAQEGLQLAAPQERPEAATPAGPLERLAETGDWLKRLWPLLLFFLALPAVKKLGKAAPYAAAALAAVALGIPLIDPTVHMLAQAAHAGALAAFHLAGHGIEIAAGWLGGAVQHIAASALPATPA